MSKYPLLCVMVCLSSSIFSATNLDQQMSLQDKQNTGVVNLTRKQKQALASWIDTHYDLKTQSTPPADAASESQGGNITLNINLNNGQELILSDGTRWQVHPQDVAVAALWIAPSPLIIKAGTDPAYPFIITNVTMGQSLRAKQIVPAQAPLMQK